MPTTAPSDPGVHPAAPAALRLDQLPERQWATVLDVLQNQNNLFTAQLEFARARYNHLQSRLLLEQAAGTLDIADVQDVNRLLTVDTASQLPAGDVPG